MSEHNPIKVDDEYYDAAREAEVAQPLSEVTRKERTALLLANVVLFAVVQGGMFPTRVEAWGLTNGQINRPAFLFLLYCAVVYYLIAFALYAWRDYRVWRLRMAFLKTWRTSALESLFTSGALEDTAFELLRADPVTKQLSDAKVRELALDRTAEAKAAGLALFKDAWQKHVPAYRAGMYFDLWVPIVLSVGNLAVSLVRTGVLRDLWGRSGLA